MVLRQVNRPLFRDLNNQVEHKDSSVLSMFGGLTETQNNRSCILADFGLVGRTVGCPQFSCPDFIFFTRIAGGIVKSTGFKSRTNRHDS